MFKIQYNTTINKDAIFLSFVPHKVTYHRTIAPLLKSTILQISCVKWLVVSSIMLLVINCNFETLAGD